MFIVVLDFLYKQFNINKMLFILPTELWIVILEFLEVPDLIMLYKNFPFFRNIIPVLENYKVLMKNKKYSHNDYYNLFSVMKKIKIIDIDYHSIYKTKFLNTAKENNLKLRKLKLNNCLDFTINELKSIKLNYLNELYLSRNVNINEYILDLLPKRLKKLTIIDSYINLKKIDKINILENLEELDLSHNFIFNQEPAKVDIINLPLLKKINLKNCNFQDGDFEKFIKNHKNLEYINFDYNNQNFDILSLVSKNCKKIKFISLNCSMRVNFDINDMIPMETLTYLNLNFSLINSIHMFKIARNIKNIEQLYINNTAVTNLGILAIGNYLKKLKYLGISYLKYVEESSIIYIIENIPDIKIIYARGIYIKEKTLAKINKKCQIRCSSSEQINLQFV
jgi:hypothetical protein